MTKATDYGAANLYDGGWRADDKEQLMAEYDLTADEADEICAELLDIENRNTYEEAKYPQIAAECVKVSNRKAYIKVSLKGGK